METKFLKVKCDELFDVEDGAYNIMVDYDLLDNKDKESLIGEVEFKIDKKATKKYAKDTFCWKLIDLQGANLGNIEDDEFNVGDYDGMIDRLEIYWHDYGFYFKNELKNCEYEIIK